MPGRISYNGIHIDFQNEWVRFNPRLASNASHVQAMSGVSQTVQFFEQEFISTQMRLAPGQDEIQLQRFFEYANDGSTFELWRDLNLGAYISFEGGGNSATVPTITPRGLQTNDLMVGTFTRTAVVDSDWHVDPFTGLLTDTSGANHIPRFIGGKYSGYGIQLDGAGVNLCEAPSGAFNGGDWTTTGSITHTANSTETLDPQGTNIADKMVTTGAGESINYETGTATGNNVAFGMWLKTAFGEQDAILTIEGVGSGVSSDEDITVTPEWQRFSMTADTSGFAGVIRVRIEFVDTARTFYGYGCGIFDDSDFDKGTIGPNQVAASKTRNLEKLIYPTSNVIVRDKMTFAAWIKPRWNGTDVNTALQLFESGDSAGANADLNTRFLLAGDVANNLAITVKRDNGTTEAISHRPVVATGLTKDTWHHVGFSWDATEANSGHIYADGEELGSASSNTAFNASDVGDTFSLGLKLDGTLPAFCGFDDVIIKKNVMGPGWFKQKASSRYALGVGRNYWSSVRLANLSYARQALRGGRSTIPLDFEEVLS